MSDPTISYSRSGKLCIPKAFFNRTIIWLKVSDLPANLILVLNLRGTRPFLRLFLFLLHAYLNIIMEEIIRSNFVHAVIGLPMNCSPRHPTFLLCRICKIADKKRNYIVFLNISTLKREDALLDCDRLLLADLSQIKSTCMLSGGRDCLENIIDLRNWIIKSSIGI
jgi:hypothetical protein